MTVPDRTVPGSNASGNTGERVVVGYFSDGGEAYRAINELMDEGFSASEVGAAFRTPRATGGAMAAADEEVDEIRSLREVTETNPALSGSVGGAGSHDEAVTPAGLAPGSGNAFPAPPSNPGPIPGAELPSTLRHDLPHDLPATSAEAQGTEVREIGTRGVWMGRLDERYGSPAAGRKSASRSSQKFGTGEGRLDLVPEHDYSAPAFESSFQGMGLSAEEARRMSGELGRGGAIVSVRAGDRVALAEQIVERNHGRVRLESAGTGARESDRESPVEVYGSMCAWYPGEQARRRAS
ncbi:MAG TPA: hypothetical protein VHX37_16970 [Acidobacteriaceae bacterium]|jgi:hypothetical protein|nr:hypothetical protein [Acidobacteriaceae bacterium]